MSTPSATCPTCKGRGFFKRLVEANPPYFADDRLEKITCAECCMEIVEAALIDEEHLVVKPCPKCGPNYPLGKLDFYCICTNHTNPSRGHLAIGGIYLCSCGHGLCQACYDELPA